MPINAESVAICPSNGMDGRASNAVAGSGSTKRTTPSVHKEADESLAKRAPYALTRFRAPDSDRVPWRVFIRALGFGTKSSRKHLAFTIEELI